MKLQLLTGSAVLVPTVVLALLAGNWDLSNRPSPAAVGGANGETPLPLRQIVPPLPTAVLTTAEEQAPDVFTFPADAAGKELAVKLPPPGQGTFPVLPPAEKKPAKISPAVNNPAVIPAPVAVTMPLLQPQTSAARTQPAPAPEAVPLEEYGILPVVPEIPKLAVGPPVRVPSVDVNQAPVLVGVKQPVADPPLLSDPTEESSHQAALSSPLPPRTEAAPFLRLNLPDPFAYRKDTSGQESLPEGGTPVTAAPIVPGP